MTIPWADRDVPYLSTEQMIEVDRAMMEDFGIDLVRMMENAGRNLAHLARERFLDGDPRGKRVVVLAGTGGNGGGALVAARRLHGYGANVEVVVTGGEMTPVPALQLAILHEIGVSVGTSPENEPTPDLIVDGLIGYSLSGNPRGATGDLIVWANQTDAPLLALDTPSGLDTTTGTRYEPAAEATATMTLALPKEGLRSEAGRTIVGELYVADISVPAELYSRDPLHLEVGRLFATSDVIRLA